MKAFQIIILYFLLIETSTFAQTGQKGADYPTITNKHLAVIVIDFPDTPQSIKDNHFPTIDALRDTIFNGRIKTYLSDMSYGQFTLTGDIFGYFTHQDPGWNEVSENWPEMDDIININTINIPEFDIGKYDAISVVSINDVGLAGARADIEGSSSILINGDSIIAPIIFVPIRIGYPHRDSINWFFQNTLTELQTYWIPIDSTSSIEGTSTINYSRFNKTYSHELIHNLGVEHARSRTNGTSYDYEPEVLNNNDFLNSDYGNKYDIMGKSDYGMSLNMVFRDIFGWTNSNNRYSIKDYGHFTTTISPLNNLNKTVTVEIRIPYDYGNPPYYFDESKNKGYFLEIRTGNDKWDNMLLHSQLQENNEGIMVLKTNGDDSYLLDMSPSPNIKYSWGSTADIRDVVLKPGMVYENNEIKLSNVIKNPDGSFTIDIDVFPFNNSPVANAGIDQSVYEGETVTLDGSGSYNVDGDSLTYSWVAPSGITLSSTSVSKPTFIAPEVSTTTDYTFSLVVNDGSLDSPVDQVIITVLDSLNSSPVANAGIDQSVYEGETVTLDGSGSYNVDGDSLTYSWVAPSGITLSSTSVSKPTFIAPEVSTTTDYTFSLVVNDGSLDSPADQVMISVLPNLLTATNPESIKFKIYPNPVSNKLIIEIEGNKKKVNFEILNSIGQVVFKGYLLEKTQVQTYRFRPGLYFIKVYTGTTYKMIKILKK